MSMVTAVMGEYCIKTGYLKNSGYSRELTQIFKDYLKNNDAKDEQIR